MSEAERLATELEAIFISEELHANKAKQIATELRRLSAENTEWTETVARADARIVALNDENVKLSAELEKVRKDAERWTHACKGNNKHINVCSWDNDAYEFVGYAMKKEAIDAIADAEIAAMKGTP